MVTERYNGFHWLMLEMRWTRLRTKFRPPMWRRWNAERMDLGKKIRMHQRWKQQGGGQ